MIKQVVHRLKIESRFFDALWDGSKTAEIRKNDRNFKVGDLLYFTQQVDICVSYGLSSSRSMATQITHIVEGKEYGIRKGYAMLSLARRN